jgi:leucyl-tRNA synthetase
MINQGMIQGRSNFAYRVNMEKMCEYAVWQLLKDNRMGVTFVKDFKDGRRRFDFFCPEKGILIEINRMGNLEKVVEPWQDYAEEKGYKLLLIPIVDVVNDFENGTHVVEQRIRDMVAGMEVPVFIEGESYHGGPLFVSKNIEGREQFSDPMHVDINMISKPVINGEVCDALDVEAFSAWRDDLNDAHFIFEKDDEGNDVYVCGMEIEKMSKSKFNVQNPDDLVEKYGADTLRLYEMFLGPLEQSKPWDVQGIEGTFRFVRKFWRLFHNENSEFCVSDEPATAPELKSLHKLIKKEEDGIESISFNTVVSAFMICVNELADLKCNKCEILEPLCIMISPYAPHIAEELWHLLGHDTSVVNAAFPVYDESKTVENSFNYPISFNGKMRFNMELPVTMSAEEVQAAVLAAPESAKWIEGKQVRKVIYVPKKIVNIVVG